MELLWVLPAVRDTLLGRLIFVTLRMGAGSPVSRRKQFRRALGCRKELFRPGKINLSDIADMISVCRATERPSGGAGAGKRACGATERPTGGAGAGERACRACQAPFLYLSMAQVRKNSGDLRRK